jgi:alpha-glucosidase
MPSGELYARWLQAAALTPFLRSHSVGWVGNKEAWEYGDAFTKINRETVELRYKFLPYLYTLFHAHERTGEPVMRPLWYEFPEDKGTYLVNDEYMIGDDVLVAPVVKEGMTTRDVYLPLGAEWVDWWTGEKLESGKTHNLPVPIDRLPIFVRVGSVIPTQNVIQSTDEMASSPITLNVVAGIGPGRTQTSELFQDAGDGYGYRRSDWRSIKFEHKQGSLKIQRAGDFRGQPIKFLEVVGLANDVRDVLGDGRKLERKFDPNRKRLRVSLAGDEREVLLVR